MERAAEFVSRLEASGPLVPPECGHGVVAGSSPASRKKADRRGSKGLRIGGSNPPAALYTYLDQRVKAGGLCG